MPITYTTHTTVTEYVKLVTTRTAQQAEDIPEINNVFHGPSDYLIVKEREVLKSGNYYKTESGWEF